MRVSRTSRLFKFLDGHGERDLVMCAAGADKRYCRFISVKTFIYKDRLHRSLTFAPGRHFVRAWKPVVRIGELAR